VDAHLVQLFCFTIFFEVLDIEPRALNMPGKCSTTNLHPPSLPPLSERPSLEGWIGVGKRLREETERPEIRLLKTLGRRL
jgi:hypothetical protein